MIGLSTRGSISFGCALVAGRKRVPRPAAGKTALRTLAAGIVTYLACAQAHSQQFESTIASRESAIPHELPQHRVYGIFEDSRHMAYVIAEPCIGTKDTACVDACPVDCIHPKKEDARFT